MRKILVLLLMIMIPGMAKPQSTVIRSKVLFPMVEVVEKDSISIELSNPILAPIDASYHKEPRLDDIATELLKMLSDSLDKMSQDSSYFYYFLPLVKFDGKTDREQWMSNVFYLDTAHCYINDHEGDLLFICKGDQHTNRFITSKKLTDAYIVRIFEYIHKSNSDSSSIHKINGVNFYFPNYNYQENRAMAQFAKSVSLVIDSCKLESIRGMKLFFSFDGKEKNKNKGFYCCLTEMCDNVLVFDTDCDTCLYYPVTIYNADSSKALPLIRRIRNQLLLARYFVEDFPEETSREEFFPADIKKIANADYPDNDWEFYFISLLVIIVLTLTITVLYWTIPRFSYYFSKNKDYVIILILILCFEVILLSFYAIEAMSRTEVVDITGNNKGLVLFIPVLLVFITPALKAIRRKRDIP